MSISWNKTIKQIFNEIYFGAEKIGGENVIALNKAKSSKWMNLLVQAQPLEIIQTFIGENHVFSLVGFFLDRFVYGTFVPFSSFPSSCANSWTSSRNSPIGSVTVPAYALHNFQHAWQSRFVIWPFKEIFLQLVQHLCRFLCVQVGSFASQIWGPVFVFQVNVINLLGLAQAS